MLSVQFTSPCWWSCSPSTSSSWCSSCSGSSPCCWSSSPCWCSFGIAIFGFLCLLLGFSYFNFLLPPLLIYVRHQLHYEKTFEPGHSISYKTACVPSEDSDQPAQLYCPEFFAGHSMGSQGAKASSGGQQRLFSLHGCAG